MEATFTDIFEAMVDIRAHLLALEYAKERIIDSVQRDVEDYFAKEAQRISALGAIQLFLMSHPDADGAAVLEDLRECVEDLSQEEAEAYLEAYNNGERVPRIPGWRKYEV